MTSLIRLPARFYDDHSDRDLPTPAAVRRTRRHVFIDAAAPELGELLSDAEFYADASGPGDGPEYVGLRTSARATAAAIRAAVEG